MREPDLVLTRDNGTVYLNRWHVIPRNRFFNVYLHQFLGSDDDRALHDHPWWFASLVLKGGYWEHHEDCWMTWRGRGSFAIRRAKTAHRVELDTTVDYEAIQDGVPFLELQRREKPAWTLVFTGPKIRSWGFHCPQGWIHWRRFDKRNGCGEK
ncbi:hypothetical protein PBI_MRMAGOO_84 [Mycobacterium phage MrMagoo]|uniref:Uncharacterized protein n=1 Tax=Mycobacterium phage MrMagoo TaxID=1927020 RepID=A0A1L6BYL0_9CAUD|nr:cysteine dioxygenase [Mycobacterium phage MrMagoo]APQ42187.1 hypothetical protein PBI_MRMAGOO_84 [Mycobacterium phage MrMagoo]ARM70262.1 hypothetical protein SEA_GARDENSALSA_84 [Mycobacterium phage GardenSalsa]